jgi:F420-dependent oxidoreductase-like protein
MEQLVRIGLMVGPERGRYAEKVAQMRADAADAEAMGFASLWVAQYPDDFDALTAVALMGEVTSTVEIGTAVVPLQTRHPVAMAQQVLSTQAVCEGRFTLGVGPSHHWVVEGMLGLSYDRPAYMVRRYLEVLNTAFAGPGPVDVENELYRIHNPLDITDLPTPILLAALAPIMLKMAGEHTAGTVLWLADERAIGDHIAPSISKSAADAGRPAPRVVAGVPVVVCRNDEVDGARAWADRLIGHAEYSPNYQRLLDKGDAGSVGDILCAGDESAVLARLQRFKDAGVTDLSVRLLPYGKTRDERIASKQRTLDYLSSICPEI